MSEMSVNRKEAFDMLNQRVEALAGMSIHDLPDTIAVEIDLGWIENLIMG